MKSRKTFEKVRRELGACSKITCRKSQGTRVTQIELIGTDKFVKILFHRCYLCAKSV